MPVKRGTSPNDPLHLFTWPTVLKSETIGKFLDFDSEAKDSTFSREELGKLETVGQVNKWSGSIEKFRVLQVYYYQCFK